MRDDSKRDDNKTLKSKLVVGSPGFATIAGHALVVINERDGGKTLQKTVVPGEKFRPPWRARGTLVPYQVALDDRLRHDFTCRLLHVDGIHTFTLHFELRYRVLPKSPHLVVMRLEVDPLGSIENEIKRVVAGPIRALDWATITERADLTTFAVEASSVDDSGELTVNMERIRIYALGFGIDVRLLTVGRHLDEGDLDGPRRTIDRVKERELRDDRLLRLEDEKREDIAKQKHVADLAVSRDRIDLAKDAELAEIAVQRTEHRKREEAAERDLASTRALNNAQVHGAKILEGYAVGMAGAVRAIAESTRSVPEIGLQLSQVDRIIESAQKIRARLNGPVDPESGLPRGTTGLLGDGTGGTAFQGPARNIEDTLARSCQVAAALPAHEPEQRRFLATILQLLAARMLEAADSEIEKHRLELLELHRTCAQDMRDDHTSFVKELAKARRPR